VSLAVLLLSAAPALAEMPAVIAGDHMVKTVELPVSDGPDDFATWVHREAMASGDECYTIERRYDFGPKPAGEGPHRPSSVAITETITCTKGGLGTYHASATLELEASWSGQGKSKLVLPRADMTLQLTRLRMPKDVGAPAQWVSPEVEWSVKGGELAFEVPEEVRGRRGKGPTLVFQQGSRKYGLVPVEAKRPKR